MNCYQYIGHIEIWTKKKRRTWILPSCTAVWLHHLSFDQTPGEEKLHGNYASMFRAFLEKNPWSSILQKSCHIFLISKPSKTKKISWILLKKQRWTLKRYSSWNPKHRRSRDGWPAKNMNQFFVDTRFRRKNLPRAMPNRDRCFERRNSCYKQDWILMAENVQREREKEKERDGERNIEWVVHVPVSITKQYF